MLVHVHVLVLVLVLVLILVLVLVLVFILVLVHVLVLVLDVDIYPGSLHTPQQVLGPRMNCVVIYKGLITPCLDQKFSIRLIILYKYRDNDYYTKTITVTIIIHNVLCNSYNYN